MTPTVVFSMICDIFFPAQLFNIHFLAIKFVHIKSLDFILFCTSLFLSFFIKSQSLYTFINTGSFAVDTETAEGRYFCVCGFVPCALWFSFDSTCITAYKTWWVEWPSVNQLEKRPPKNNPMTIKPKYIQRANINTVPRAASSGDQGDCTTESHMSPTTEVHTTNSENQNRSI